MFQIENHFTDSTVRNTAETGDKYRQSPVKNQTVKLQSR